MRSIMQQTLQDIEIIVVDDASTDGSPEILERLSEEDLRIRVLSLNKNVRLARALNYGLDHVRAPYIARMDDDDCALPNRLEVQKRFLDNHPEIDLAGASTERVDESGRRFRSRVRALDSFAVRWQARFALNVAHPTFMFRTHMPDGSLIRYDAKWPLSQDHDLICRLFNAGGHAVCLPEILLNFRLHNASVSRSRFKEQVGASEKICLEFQKMELPPEIVAALEPLRQLYFKSVRAEPEITKGAFIGAHMMLDHDCHLFPDRRVWLRRQVAQLLDWALRRGGKSSRVILQDFVRCSPALLPALGFRLIETRGVLPWIDSGPDVW